MEHCTIYNSFRGLAMFFWAFFIDYDSLSFFGIRQILDFGKEKRINQSKDLKQSGLLRVVRHPMYFALIIALWCDTFIMTGIMVNVILTYYVIMGTILEEKKLVLEFGECICQIPAKSADVDSVYLRFPYLLMVACRIVCKLDGPVIPHVNPHT
jgi:hypothetical protein